MRTLHTDRSPDGAPLSRRAFLSGLGATVVVAGFDPIGRRWVPAAEAATSSPFAGAPRLDGQLLLDTSSRTADSTDNGNIAHQMPVAVLRPTSVRDIQVMIGFCGHHEIKVSARGQAHTTFGQSLSPGLVIENRSRKTIHSIGPGGADVDAGVLWTELIEAAWQQGLTPPVITNYTNFAIAGTLSVGGVSPNFHRGAQVDTVQQLEVVTGTGDVVTCSPSRNAALFDVALAGLGQCAVITRAKVNLIRAPKMVRQYNLNYTDIAQFFGDYRTLLGRGELDELVSAWLPSGTSAVASQLQAVTYYDPASPPDNRHLLRGLSVPPAAVTWVDLDYLDFALRFNPVIDSIPDYESIVKPWSCLILPDGAVQQFVADVMPLLTLDDVGPSEGGFLLLQAAPRARFGRPFMRLPSSNDWIWFFNLLTSAPAPIAPAGFADQMLTRNRALFDRAHAVGATRYPVDAIEFTSEDWTEQYGPVWPDLVARKRRYDPNGILTPGPGIF